MYSSDCSPRVNCWQQAIACYHVFFAFVSLSAFRVPRRGCFDAHVLPGNVQQIFDDVLHDSPLRE